ncbi:hypothetical protein AHAS_Ahas13G0212500 [Arachis hypogaea]
MLNSPSILCPSSLSCYPPPSPPPQPSTSEIFASSQVPLDPHQDLNSFDPMCSIRFCADGGNIQFEINHPSNQGLCLPTNTIGDYFLSFGLEQLIQQLSENDPNLYGTPPAPKTTMKNLLTVTVDDELLNSEHNQCAICKDE